MVFNKITWFHLNTTKTTINRTEQLKKQRKLAELKWHESNMKNMANHIIGHVWEKKTLKIIILLPLSDRGGIFHEKMLLILCIVYIVVVAVVVDVPFFLITNYLNRTHQHAVEMYTHLLVCTAHLLRQIRFHFIDNVLINISDDRRFKCSLSFVVLIWCHEKCFYRIFNDAWEYSWHRQPLRNR